MILSQNVQMNPKFFKEIARRNVQVEMKHFEHALEEVKPAFGVAEDDFATFLRGRLLNVGSEFEKVCCVSLKARHVVQIKTTVNTAIQQIKASASTQVISVLLEGPSGSGKTALASRLAVDSL